MNESCDLCRLHSLRELKSTLHYENEQFIVVDCIICQTPMVVLKAHRPSFNDHEKNTLAKMLIELFGIHGVLDWEQRKIPEHAHVHLRPRPFPGTVTVPLSQYV
ncbi:MAG: hypothetical protein OEM52_00855 [bacterium]|nr:hypothetical protein [bacterium]